jgi:hypothetical protein
VDVVTIVDPVPAFPEFPAATQFDVEIQETDVRSTASEGEDSADQLAPLLVVSNANVVGSKFVPTAIQVPIVGQLRAFN